MEYVMAPWWGSSCCFATSGPGLKSWPEVLALTLFVWNLRVLPMHMRLFFLVSKLPPTFQKTWLLDYLVILNCPWVKVYVLLVFCPVSLCPTVWANNLGNSNWQKNISYTVCVFNHCLVSGIPNSCSKMWRAGGNFIWYFKKEESLSLVSQFVPFRDYMDRTGNHVLSMARLAKDVLAEIPDQLISYMKSRAIKPSPVPPPYSSCKQPETESVWSPPPSQHCPGWGWFQINASYYLRRNWKCFRGSFTPVKRTQQNSVRSLGRETAVEELVGNQSIIFLWEH